MLFVERRVHAIHILLIQPFTQQLHCLTKALEMHDLSLAQELDYIVHIWIVAQAQNIIIGYTGFLFWERIA